MIYGKFQQEIDNFEFLIRKAFALIPVIIKNIKAHNPNCAFLVKKKNR